MKMNDKGILPQQQGELTRAKQAGALHHFIVGEMILDKSLPALDVANICSLVSAEVESIEAFHFTLQKAEEKWRLQPVELASDCVLVRTRPTQETATRSEQDSPISLLKALLSSDTCLHDAVIEVHMTEDSRINITAVFSPWLTDPKGLDIFLKKLQATIEDHHLSRQVENEQTHEVVSFEEYVQWQWDILELEEAQIGQQFWKQQLRKGRNAQVIPWFNNISRTEASSFEVQEVIQTLPQSLLEKIDAYVSKHRVSHAALFLSCWALLQSRITQESNFLTHVRVNGREDSDLEAFIGPCDTVVPVAINIKQNAPFIQNIKDVEDALTEAGEWQECLGFLDIQELPSLFSYSDSAFVNAENADGLPAESHGLSDLVVNIVDRRQIRWVGCTRFFKKDALSLLAKYMEQLLQQLLLSPIAITASLTIEQVQEMPVSGEQQPSQPNFTPIHQQFFAAAEQFAHLPAIESGTTLVTYQQLSDQVRDFAARLQGCGVAKHETVAVCLPHGVELIVAMLAVMEVGANFVGVALPMPVKRIKHLVKDARVSCYIAEQDLDIGAGIMPVLLSEHFESQSHSSPVDISPDTLAYKIFTSGSTGQPKSVMIDHGAIALQLSSFQDWVKLSSNDRVVLRTHCGFDAFVWEAFLPLLKGARLLISQGTAPDDISGLLTLLKTHQASVLQVTPSLLRILLRDGGKESLANLRLLVVGGEQFTADLQVALSGAGCEVLNVYGPAEACIHTTAFSVQSSHFKGGVPIGQPLSGYACKVVDENGSEVATGLEGQLCVAGRGLFQGYCNDPELTAQSFLTTETTSHDTTTWYKTGDKVRRLPNGTFEYLGRLNRQLKVNGYRVDLNEITTAVECCNGVEQAYALVIRQHEQDVLFVVFQAKPNNEGVDEASIRTCLQQQLPHYLLPSGIIEVQSIPLNRNGKVDAEALRAYVAKANTSEFTRPKTDTEKRVLVVWQELLESNAISIHDNFYLIGGHSLLFSRLVIRLNEVFCLDLALVDLLRYTTIAQIAGCIDSRLGAREAS